jgi:hypothetical protein
LIIGCLVDAVAVMDDVFILVYNFHVPLALKVGCPSSGVGCDIVLVFKFLCVGLMAIFCAVVSYSGFLSTGVHFVVSQSWCGVCRLLVEFLGVQVSLCVTDLSHATGCKHPRLRMVLMKFVVVM